jgi:hypothetical protein
MSCQGAWCGVALGHKASEIKGISHGICNPCAAKIPAELDQPTTGPQPMAVDVKLAVRPERY